MAFYDKFQKVPLPQPGDKRYKYDRENEKFIPYISTGKFPPPLNWQNKEQLDTKVKNGKNYGVSLKHNNLFCFDLDTTKWDKNTHIFYDYIGSKSNHLENIKNWVEKQNTLVQQSCSGGYHVVYKYPKAFDTYKKVTDSPHNIDILFGNAYFVGAGSEAYIGKTKDIGEYKIVNHIEPQEIPKDLLDWIINTFCMEQKKNNEKLKKVKRVKSLDTHQTITELPFCYANLNVKIVQELMDKIPDKYWKNMMRTEM